MITITTNIQAVSKEMIAKLQSIIKADEVVRITAAHMAGVIRERIHNEGKNASGNKIGKYSKKYLKRRAKKNRNESNVVISLNRDLENDFGLGQTSPIRTATGWGLGFKKDDREGVSNYDKSQWMEERFGKIWGLTSAELKEAKRVVEFEVKKRLA